MTLSRYILPLSVLREQARVLAVQYLVVLTMLGSKIISWNVWHNQRIYPRAPLFDALPPLTAPWDHRLLYTTMLLLLAQLAFPFRRIFLWAYLALELFSCLTDQMRWQPWFVQYILFLLALSALKPKSAALDRHRILNLVALIMMGTWFWGGVHKINPGFIHSIFAPMLYQVFGITDLQEINTWVKVGYILPFIEAALPFVLLFPRLRKLGVGLAVFMHLFILFYLGPWGLNINYVVWPWNLLLLVLSPIVFWGRALDFSLWKQNPVYSRLVAGVVAFHILMPALNLLGLWDDLLSGSIYSGKSEMMYVVVKKKAIPRMPFHFTRWFLASSYIQDSTARIINFNNWALQEMNVVINPERRIYRKLIRPFCQMGLREEEITFMMLKEGELTPYTCAEVEAGFVKR